MTPVIEEKYNSIKDDLLYAILKALNMEAIIEEIYFSKENDLLYAILKEIANLTSGIGANSTKHYKAYYHNGSNIDLHYIVKNEIGKIWIEKTDITGKFYLKSVGLFLYQKTIVRLSNGNPSEPSTFPRHTFIDTNTILVELLQSGGATSWDYVTGTPQELLLEIEVEPVDPIIVSGSIPDPGYGSGYYDGGIGIGIVHMVP